jgi:low temperature requirement protein LtrA
MNFTWFASAYDPDDIAYRLAVFVQMTGALIFAAGVSGFFEGDLTIGTIGYVVMRFAMVGQWLRAAACDPPRAATAHRYAGGIALAQAGWVGLLFAPEAFRLPGFFVLVLVELLVPVHAERAAATSWHRHHIAERYGLMTIIVLGESILAATVAFRSAFEEGTRIAALAPLIAGGLLIVFSMWWLYFFAPVAGLLTSLPRAFVWGYGHYLVFALAAAAGAGLALAVDVVAGRSAVTPAAADAAVAWPVAGFLLVLWLLHYRPGHAGGRLSGPVAAVLIALTPLTGFGILLTGVILALLLALKLARGAADG